MSSAGIIFHTLVNIGEDGTSLTHLREHFDAVILAVGSTRPRLIPVPGAQLTGVYPAMTYLEEANRAVATNRPAHINAAEKHVVILGGGDTGADCLGTAHRQGAASVTQIEIMDEPPHERPSDQPWPIMARLFKVTSAHEEGGARHFATETLEF